MGCQGFKEFKEDLERSSLQEQVIDYNFPFGADTPLLDVAQSVIAAEVAALRSMAAMFTPQALQKAGDLLRQAQVIDLCAIGSS